LSAGLAGGADIVLIPEIPYDLDSICQHLTERRRRGKWFSIVAVAEGAVPKQTVAQQPPPATMVVSADKAKKKAKKKAARAEREAATQATPDSDNGSLLPG